MGVSETIHYLPKWVSNKTYSFQTIRDYMNLQKFYKSPQDVFACHGFVSPKTGDFVEIKSTDKLILIYMLDRTPHLTATTGKHFETQSTIGDAVGVEWKAAARSLKMFVEHEVIAGRKERNLAISPHLCYYYSAVNTDVVFCKRDEIVVDTAEICDSMAPEYDEEYLASINFGG